MDSVAQPRKIPIEKAPSFAALVHVAAHAVKDHGALGRGVELRTPIIRAARHKGILPNPEHFVDGVEGVDLEFVIRVFAGDEYLHIVVFVDFGIALGEISAHVRFFRGEAEVEAFVVPEHGYAGIEPSGLAGDDIDEGRGLRGDAPGRFVEPAIDDDGSGGAVAGVVSYIVSHDDFSILRGIVCGMSRTFLARMSAAVLLLAGCWIAYTQNAGKQAPALTLNKIKDDLYEIEGDGGNVAVYVTGEGVILVDDKFDQDHENIVAKVKSVTDQPVKYVVTTHHHSDHSGGNAKFLPTAEIISTANARQNIVEHKQPGANDVAPARMTFTTECSIFLGGKEVRALYCGRGHTNGDAVVYFPALHTLHTGDLMAGKTPLIDYPGGGSVKGWTETLDNAMKLDFDTVIPGHGPVTDKAGLKTYRDNVEKLRNRAAGLIREGKGQEEVGKVMAAEFGWAPGSMQAQWSLPGIMQELK